MKGIVVLFIVVAIGAIISAIVATVHKVQGFPRAMETLDIVILYTAGIVFGLFAFILIIFEKEANKDIEKSFKNPVY
jgi:hypothetical protein